MTGPTKILTVSYGTFSCTLEGFDDPFGTMRGIAEYFRDLAADDRYFGAEPPTPDVEMLQRIAEKEVQRRVDARMGETGVALTQLTDDTAETAPEAPEVPEAVESAEAKPVAREEPRPVEPIVDEDDAFDSGPLTHDDEFLLSDEPEDVLAVDPAAAPPADGPAETVAEKLRRIRAVVSRSIEPEADQDSTSFSDAQALDADADEAPVKRNRAYTRTIEQISEDIAEDDDMPLDVVADEDNLIADENDEIAPSEVAIAADDGWDFDIEGLNSPSADGSGADEDVEPQDEEPEDDDADVLGSVLSKARAEMAEADDTPDDEPTEAPRRERRVSRPLTPITDEGEDVGRLLAETDNQLNDGESVRRRRVISQMRAAVAATKADRLVSRAVSTSQEASPETAYRSDLSQVVRDVSRPQPSETNEAASERRPSVAPLVLVSSQRVDDAEGSDEGNAPQDFAEFAKTMGAKELPDLMEAAAAFTSFVEGQASFSRPEIMKRVARVDPSLIASREDGLRSFGQLLRQGKLRKLERGQFTVAETTRFRPEQRFAGE